MPAPPLARASGAPGLSLPGAPCHPDHDRHSPRIGRVSCRCGSTSPADRCRRGGRL